MLKKIWAVYIRDIRVNTREAITIYLILAPVLLALAINALSPSINDTTVKLALIEGENPTQVEYLENFARVSLYKDIEAVKRTILSSAMPIDD